MGSCLEEKEREKYDGKQSAYQKIIFLPLNQNICCGYSKEPSLRDGSFEHPKYMLKMMSKKILTIARRKFSVYLNLRIYHRNELLHLLNPFTN